MLRGKGREAINKIDQNQADLPPSRESKAGHAHATNLDETDPMLKDTALPTVAYTIGIGMVLYLGYILFTYGISSLA